MPQARKKKSANTAPSMKKHTRLPFVVLRSPDPFSGGTSNVGSVTTVEAMVQASLKWRIGYWNCPLTTKRLKADQFEEKFKPFQSPCVYGHLCEALRQEEDNHELGTRSRDLSDCSMDLNLQRRPRSSRKRRSVKRSNRRGWLLAFICSSFFVLSVMPQMRILSTQLIHAGLYNTTWSGADPNTVDKIDVRGSFQGALNDSIGNLTDLKYLSFGCSGGRENVIPSTLGNLNQLQYLNLRNCNMIGDIPSSLGKLTNLQDLDLSYNHLEGIIPDEIFNLTQLKTLKLNENSINGTLSLLIGNLLQLESLDLGATLIDGTPWTICQLYNLTSLSFGKTKQQNNTLLPCIGNLTKLMNLNFGGSGINGPIPSSFCESLYETHQLTLPANLVNLTTLILGTNDLSGIIPPDFSKLVNLQTLYLDNNHLTGQIPSDISNLTQLEILGLGNNNLTGDIPILPANLGTLDLSNNQFHALKDGIIGSTLVGNCNLSGNRIPCFSAPTSPPCNIQCLKCTNQACQAPADPEDLYRFNDTMTSQIATNLLNSADPSLNSTIPTLLTIITDVALRSSTPLNVTTDRYTLLLDKPIYSERIVTLTDPAKKIGASFPLSLFRNESVMVSLSTVSFNPYASLDDASVYNPVIGVTVYNVSGRISIHNSTENVNITMGNMNFTDGYDYFCMYWKEDDSRWGRDGCNLITDNITVVCQCNHLTNFTLGRSAAVPLPSIVPSPTQVGFNKLLIIIPVAAVVAIVVIVLIILFIVNRNLRQRRLRAQSAISMEVEKQSSSSFGNVLYEELIHRGTHEVWRGLWNDTTLVAIKKAFDLSRHSPLFKEASIIKGMRHPQIIQYLEQNVTDGCFLMEWMNQGNVDRYMANQALDVPVALSIALDVAKGMTYVASQGIVHTCLCTRKVLINETTKGQVTAKIGGLSHTTTVTSPATTKPAYFSSHTAPEIVKGKPQKISADVWSYGFFLYSLLSNNRDPHSGLSSEQILQRKKRGEDRFECDGSWDEVLRNIITSSTDEREAKRPTFEQIAKDIRFLLKGPEEEAHTMEEYEDPSLYNTAANQVYTRVDESNLNSSSVYTRADGSLPPRYSSDEREYVEMLTAPEVSERLPAGSCLNRLRILSSCERILARTNMNSHASLFVSFLFLIVCPIVHGQDLNTNTTDPQTTTDPCQDQPLEDYDLELHVASIFILFSVAGVGVVTPTVLKLLKLDLQHPSIRWALTVGKFFGSGVILATAFIHMLSDAFEQFSNPCLTGIWVDYGAFTGLFTMAASLIIHFIEFLSLRAIDNIIARKKAKCQSEEKAVTIEDGVVIEDDDHSSEDHNHAHGLLLMDDDGSKGVSIYLLELGITIHSVLIGVSLAVTTGSDFRSLLAALCFHQFFEGIGLGTRIIELKNKSWKKPILMCVIYSLTTPIGIAIGIGARHSYNENSTQSIVSSGILDALAAGILLYNVYVNILAAEINSNRQFRSKSWRSLSVCFIAFYLGCASMAVVGYWA
ncbi:hypothetical protein PROFUN_00614 [Planoprotostelium fungivorum]|uniref:Leucine-rich repeat receptor-like protein kinase n=1 Tax=Planoprotostelium fungivorum TaxID=1890364 RepID=A0A2P6NTU8_9EUKA|nr:hypothetical protein PROFUN_00614 [Planoprotostelium fungivorum]